MYCVTIMYLKLIWQKMGGGGLYSLKLLPTISVYNSTFTNNSAPSGGALSIHTNSKSEIRGLS